MKPAPVIRDAAIRSVHPPASFMRFVVNPLVRLIVHTPLGRRAPSLAVLRFRGRRTDRGYKIPVVAHDLDGSMLVCTDASWAKNFTEATDLTIRQAGRTTRATAHIIHDPQPAANAMRRIITAKQPRALGLAVDPGHDPTDAELNSMRRVIRITTR